MATAFDNEKYIRIQSEHIRERIAQFGNKLYLELGGKLFDDLHASRVLPGFMPDSKLQMLTQLQDSLEISFARRVYPPWVYGIFGGDYALYGPTFGRYVSPATGA